MNKEKKKRVKTRGNGEGTIYFDNTRNIYVGQYCVNRKKHSIYQRKKETNTEFKRRFNRTLNEIHQGIYTENSKETVVTIIKEYIDNKHLDKITSDRTYKRDLETLEQVKKTCKNFCDIPIQKVTLKHIEKAKLEMKSYSNSVIDKIWSFLIKAFKIACSPSIKILN